MVGIFVPAILLNFLLTSPLLCGVVPRREGHRAALILAGFSRHLAGCYTPWHIGLPIRHA